MLNKLPYSIKQKLYKLGQKLILLQYTPSSSNIEIKSAVLHDLQLKVQQQQWEISKLKLEVGFARSQFVSLAKTIHQRK